MDDDEVQEQAALAVEYGFRAAAAMTPLLRLCDGCQDKVIEYLTSAADSVREGDPDGV